MAAEEVARRVVAIVAEALDRDPATVTPDSTLIDDLGAESIDFLDLQFQIESAFGIEIPNDEIWDGSLVYDPQDPASLRAALDDLRRRRPQMRWDRFPENPTVADLPSLITVQTIIDYVQGRVAAAP